MLDHPNLSYRAAAHAAKSSYVSQARTRQPTERRGRTRLETFVNGFGQEVTIKRPPRQRKTRYDIGVYGDERRPAAREYDYDATY